MVNKFISQFWVLSAKSVRFNKHTKYTLNIEKYINEKLKGESAIDDLCTNFRRIRMDSIELYEETVNNVGVKLSQKISDLSNGTYTVVL